jgi:hypothetical protein
LEGETEAAKDFVAKGLNKIQDLPFEGQRKFEQKWMQALMEKAL